MRPPIFFVATCPHCGREADITAMSAGLYYLAGSWWFCPHCRGYSTTEELHEATDGPRAGQDPEPEKEAVAR